MNPGTAIGAQYDERTATRRLAGCRVRWSVDEGEAYWNERLAAAIKKAAQDVHAEWLRHEQEQAVVNPRRRLTPCPGGCPD